MTRSRNVRSSVALLTVVPTLALATTLAGCSSGESAAPPARSGPATGTASLAPAAPAAPGTTPSTATQKPVQAQTATGDVAGTVPRTGTAADVWRCQDGETAATLVPDTSARSHKPWKGSAGATVMFTNVSRRSCWLYGYPGIAFYRNGKPFSRGSSPLPGVDPVTRVTLAPGRSGYAELVWNAQSADDRAVDEIGIIAPDQTKQFRGQVTRLVMASQARDISVLPVTATLDPRPGPGPA